MASILILFLVLMQSVSAQEYTAKSGDLVTVTVWERQTLSGTVTVDGNGNITLAMPIGSVPVLGLTATQISGLLAERLKEYLVNPTVFVSISPAGGFVVHVLGEVNSPNFIKVPDGTTVQEAISRAGGFTAFANKRHIQLIHKEDSRLKTQDLRQKTESSLESNVLDLESELTLDFERFIEDGDRSANPTLESGDVLIVPRLSKSERTKYISVIGAVVEPGTFDVEEPSPLIEVLARAGGPSSSAVLEDISVLNISDGNYLWKHVNFESFLTGGDVKANPYVSPGSTVFIPGEPKEKRPFTVNVVGQVVNPGVYPATDDSRLFGAIYLAGGFVDEAAIDKVTLIHQNPQSPIEEQVNVSEYLISGDKKYNPLLTKGDTIFVPMLEDAKRIPAVHTPFFPTIRISIIGEVAKPDIYRISAQASILDILKIAGGPTSEADLKRVAVIREASEVDDEQKRQIVDLEKVLTEGKFQLLPGLSSDDTIFVPKLKPGKNVWGTIVKIAADISTIAVAYLLIAKRSR